MRDGGAIAPLSEPPPSTEVLLVLDDDAPSQATNKTRMPTAIGRMPRPILLTSVPRRWLLPSMEQGHSRRCHRAHSTSETLARRDNESTLPARFVAGAEDVYCDGAFYLSP